MVGGGRYLSKKVNEAAVGSEDAHYPIRQWVHYPKYSNYAHWSEGDACMPGIPCIKSDLILKG